MNAWKSNSELRLFKRMLYAFSFSTLSCIICGIDAMKGIMPVPLCVVLALLCVLLMLIWIFLAFPEAKNKRNTSVIQSVAKICTTIGIVFIVFTTIGVNDLLEIEKFVYLAALPYMLIGILSWVIVYINKHY